MAAVGAYNSKGELIGGSIGWSSKPILASNIFPVLLAYGYLTRVSFSTIPECSVALMVDNPQVDLNVIQSHQPSFCGGE